MKDVIAFVFAGVAVGLLVRVLLRPLFELPLLARENYRGRTVATAAGIAVVLAAIVVEAARQVLASFDVGRRMGPTRGLVLFAVAAFGFLGLLDDVVGSGHARGFRGHVGELARGRLTTGGVKLVGGFAAAAVIAGSVDGHLPGRLFADAALIALSANLASQLDRRPGRMIKVAVVAFVVLLATGAMHEYLEGVAVVVGATIALVVDDLRERLMLGDTGANVVGACLGTGAVFAFTFDVRLALLAVVAALNLVGELSSFTRLIDAFPPLRVLDRAGRVDP